LNSIAGGGSFLSLPALFASATGVGAVAIQATNTVALWPGQLTGMYAFRKELREYKRELLPLGVAAGLGGWLGGQLLLRTGNHMFLKLLPWLLLFDMHEMNALKVLTAAVSIGIPAITFIAAGRVQWYFCFEMAILAALGGFIGAHYSRLINQAIMRRTVAAIGFMTSAYFFAQNYAMHPVR
jgi:uncharacterized membrane protein YfcA